MSEEMKANSVPFSGAEVVYAWVSIVLGYLLCRVFTCLQSSLAGFLVMIGLYAITFLVFAVQKKAIPLSSVLGAVWALLVCTASIVTESLFLRILSYAYALFTYAYIVYSVTGNKLEAGFSDLVFLDYAKALFVLPFLSYVKLFPALGQGKSKNTAFLLLKVLIGIAIAAIPTLVVLFLLCYDGNFVQIMEDLFHTEPLTVFSRIVSLLLAVPTAMYLFGLYHASTRNRLADQMTAQQCTYIANKCRIVPQVTVLTASVPLLFLYGVFFVSQWQYYVSGFTGVLPEGFSYAQYAREGFFQLCTVSVINLVMILLFRILGRKGKNGKMPIIKLISVLFCLSTLVLISTAIAKLVMYIDYYGLTHKRIYAFWMMCVIGVVFLIIAVGQFIPKAKITATAFSVCVLLFGLLALCNVSQITAQYNVNRYISGSLETVDMDALTDLGNSAVPSVVRLAKHLKETPASPERDALIHQAEYFLQEQKEYLQWEQDTVFAWNLPSWQAKKAIEGYPLPNPEDAP